MIAEYGKGPVSLRRGLIFSPEGPYSQLLELLFNISISILQTFQSSDRPCLFIAFLESFQEATVRMGVINGIRTMPGADFDAVHICRSIRVASPFDIIIETKLQQVWHQGYDLHLDHFPMQPYFLDGVFLIVIACEICLILPEPVEIFLILRLRKNQRGNW